MPNELGKIKAAPKTTAPAAGAAPASPGGGEKPPAGPEPAAPADSSLPDPTKYAKWALVGLLLVSLAAPWYGTG